LKVSVKKPLGLEASPPTNHALLPAERARDRKWAGTSQWRRIVMGLPPLREGAEGAAFHEGALHVVGHYVRELTNIANLNRCPQPQVQHPLRRQQAGRTKVNFVVLHELTNIVSS
jgi:hypothetical protein